MSKVHMVDGVACAGFEAGVVKVSVNLLNTMAQKTEYKESGVRAWMKNWIRENFENKIQEFEKSLDLDSLVSAFNSYVEEKKTSRPAKEKTELDLKLEQAKVEYEKLRAEKKAKREAAKTEEKKEQSTV